MSAVSNEEIIDLIKKAQQTLPEDEQRPFVEKVTERIGEVLGENKNALIGAGAGYLIGEIIDHVPVLGWITGDYGNVAGALIGGWIGHSKDAREREMRTKIGQVVAEELQKSHGTGAE